MKSIYVSFFCFFGLIAAGFTQQKQIAKAVIKTPTIQCEACKDRVERRLFKEDGIASVKADYRRHIVTVTYYKDRTNIENIKTSLANLGYDADD
ncbi:MAG: heavy-metal-associated domain-containing protein, partial [Ginsengibacter sp.]